MTAAENESNQKSDTTAPIEKKAALRKEGSQSEGVGREKTGNADSQNGVSAQEGSGRSGYHGQSGYGYSDRHERPRAAAMEVVVENNIEKAMKVLKRKLIKEGLFKELKSRRYYEKPSERKKRKHKESVKKVRKEEMRQKRGAFLFS